VTGFLVGVLLASITFFSSPRVSRYIFSTGVMVRYSDLAIQISPPGYPLVGESWRIEVYVVNVSSGIPTFKPALNSTVVVTLLSSGRRRTYELPVDENGVTTFQYRSAYSDIAFQAYHTGLTPSGKVVISRHYVSSNVVDDLWTINASISIFGSLASGFAIRKRELKGKSGKLTKWILLLIFLLFSFVAIFSTYSKFFQGTTWGYPENVVGSIITLTSLRYAMFLGIVLLLLYWVVFFLLPKKDEHTRSRQRKKQRQIKSRRLRTS